MHRVEQHYIENQRKLLKRLQFRAGTEWDAQDVLHDAYERALKYIHSFKGDNIGPWFNTIMNNALREHKNASKGFATSSFDEEDEEGVPCNHYSERVVKEINDLIDTKSVVQMEVLKLHFQQDYSARDIARISEHSYNNCQKIIVRFKQELKELYQ
jgi:RNA polymerase sigma factor (sigma-70 family)